MNKLTVKAADILAEEITRLQLKAARERIIDRLECLRLAINLCEKSVDAPTIIECARVFLAFIDEAEQHAADKG